MSKACGLVTSWIRCKPTNNCVWPLGNVRTVWRSQTFWKSVEGMNADGTTAAASLGRWTAGPLVRWAAGPLGRWFAMPLVRWFAGPLVRRSVSRSQHAWNMACHEKSPKVPFQRVRGNGCGFREPCRRNGLQFLGGTYGKSEILSYRDLDAWRT